MFSICFDHKNTFETNQNVKSYAFDKVIFVNQNRMERQQTYIAKFVLY